MKFVAATTHLYEASQFYQRQLQWVEASSNLEDLNTICLPRI